MLAMVLYGLRPEPAYAQVEVRLTDLACSLKKAFRSVRASVWKPFPNKPMFPEILKWITS